MNRSLIIRADAGPQIGTGHVMRCLALAQAWQDTGGRVKFVTANPPPPIRERLQASGVQSIEMSCEPGSAADLAELRRLAVETSAAWVVVDGYAFDETYQRRLKEADLRVLFVDDYGHAKHYWTDFVLNQNLGAKADLYQSKEPYTQLLLGNRYVLLRREFLKRRDWQRTIPDRAQKILVTLGGSDPDNVTLKVLQALQQLQIPRVKAKIVVGPLNRHFELLRAVAGDVPGNVQLLTAVGNMPELMAWAEIAVSAGGSTCWELAFMGLPTIVLVLAQNQKTVAKASNEAGIALNLGGHENVSVVQLAEALFTLVRSSELRCRMSHRGRDLVDGAGTDRVVSKMKSRLQTAGA